MSIVHARHQQLTLLAGHAEQLARRPRQLDSEVHVEQLLLELDRAVAPATTLNDLEAALLQRALRFARAALPTSHPAAGAIRPRLTGDSRASTEGSGHVG